MTRDQVCDKQVDENNAPAQSEYHGETFYFHSDECKRKFDEDPEKFVHYDESSSS